MDATLPTDPPDRLPGRRGLLSLAAAAGAVTALAGLAASTASCAPQRPTGSPALPVGNGRLGALASRGTTSVPYGGMSRKMSLNPGEATVLREFGR
ncbi:hypothetical protein OG698_06145 [Streptomyces sp. NBC_01003]|nr:hypothetical protein OG698_06145 [Streptomyces sp. NBC_01003]